MHRLVADHDKLTSHHTFISPEPDAHPRPAFIFVCEAVGLGFLELVGTIIQLSDDVYLNPKSVHIPVYLKPSLSGQKQRYVPLKILHRRGYNCTTVQLQTLWKHLACLYVYTQRLNYLYTHLYITYIYLFNSTLYLSSYISLSIVLESV